MVSIESIYSRQIKKTIEYVLNQFGITGYIFIDYDYGIISAKVTPIENLDYYQSVKRFADDKIVELSQSLGNKYFIILNSYNSYIDNGEIMYDFTFTQSSPLMDLPIEILHIIMNDFSYDEIDEICSTSTDLNEQICLNQTFWRQKYISMTGFNPPPDIDMRQAVNNYGKALSFGSNINGQLGVHSNEDMILEPTPVRLNKSILDVSLGLSTCIFTDVDNNIFVSGFYIKDSKINTYPVLMEQNYIKTGRDISLYIVKLSTIKIVPSIFHSTQILDSVDIVNNELINGLSSIITIKDDKLIALTNNILVSNLLYTDPITNYFYETKFEFNIKKIYMGYSCVFMITNDDIVYVVGYNSNKKLGVGSIHNNYIIDPILVQIPGKVKMISCGYVNTLFLTENGDVFFSGLDKNGTNIDIPVYVHFESKITKISSGYNFSLFLDENNNVWIDHYNISEVKVIEVKDHTIPQIVMPEYRFIDISAGRKHALLLDEHYDLYTSGNNEFGQLGHKDTVSRYTPTKVEIPYKIKSIHSGLISNYSVITIMY